MHLLTNCVISRRSWIGHSGRGAGRIVIETAITPFLKKPEQLATISKIVYNVELMQLVFKRRATKTTCDKTKFNKYSNQNVLAQNILYR